MQSNIKYIVLSLLFAVSPLLSAAQEVIIPFPSSGSTEVSISYPKPTAKHTVVTSGVELQLGFTDVYKLAKECTNCNNGFSLEVQVQIDVYDGQTMKNSTPFTKTLKISNTGTNSNPVTLASEYLELKSMLPFTEVKITLANANIISNVGSGIQGYFSSHRTLTAKYVQQLNYLPLVEGSNAPIKPIVKNLHKNTLLNPSEEIKKRFQTFEWSISNIEHIKPIYELELLKLYNIKEPASTNPITEQEILEAEVDWRNALRYQTQDIENKMKLTVAEGTGFYIWRVRLIGDYYEGGVNNPKNYGAWSDAPQQNQKLSNVNITYARDNDFAFYFTDLDQDKNWAYSRTFTEGDRVHETIVYANGLRQVVQNQTNIGDSKFQIVTNGPTTEEKLNLESFANQTVVDFRGVPSLTTLPVPVDDNQDLYYKKGFLKTGSGEIYRDKHFDTDAKRNAPETVESSTSAYKFYSSGNADKSVASAEGYPFSRTLFDPAGETIEQSGVGHKHKLGSNHTTRIAYTTPSAEELIWMFGDNAPQAIDVIKTVTTDPNGVNSITYSTPDDKVIATALERKVPDSNIIPRTAKYEASVNTVTTKESSSSIKVHYSTDQTLLVNYIPHILTTQALCNTPGGCTFNLKVTIHDINGKLIAHTSIQLPPNLSGNPLSVVTWELNSSANSPTPYIYTATEGSGTVYKIKQGVYVFSKTLSLVSGPSASAASANIGQDVEPLMDFFVEKLNGVENATDMQIYLEMVQGLSSCLASNPLNPQNCISQVTNWNYTLPNSAVVNVQKQTIPFIFNPDDKITLLKGDIDAPVVKYVGGNLKEEDFPTHLRVKVSCCDAFTIPLIPAPTTCLPVAELRGNITLTPDFAGYLFAQLKDDTDLSLNDQEEVVTKYAPGYNPSTLNSMFYHMITDRYYVGRTKIDGSTRKKQLIDVNGDFVLEPEKADPFSTSDPDPLMKEQYTCPDLWKAWKAVIKTQKQLNEAITAAKQNQGGNGLFNGKTDLTQGVDNALKESGFAFFAKIFLGKKSLSTKLNDDNKGDNLPTPPDHIVSRFLDVVGYKFADIITGYSATASSCDLATGVYRTHVFNADHYEYNSTRWNSSGNPAAPTSGNPLKPVLPYIKNPVFAFKYFEYPSDGDKKNIELLTCYANPPSNITLCVDPCKGITRRGGDWTASERLKFYLLLKNSKAVEEDNIDPDNPDGTLSESELYAELTALITKCKNSCKDRATEYRQSILADLEAKCYELSGCVSTSPGIGDNVVLTEEVDELTANFLTICENTCAALGTPDQGITYPRNNSVPNCYVLIDGNYITKTVNMYELMSKTDYYRYQQITTWRTSAQLDLTTKCPGGTTTTPYWWTLPHTNSTSPYGPSTSVPKQTFEIPNAQPNPPLQKLDRPVDNPADGANDDLWDAKFEIPKPVSEVFEQQLNPVP